MLKEEEKSALTHHARQRLKQRVGLNKKSANRVADRALGLGLRHAELKGSLIKYANELYLKNKNINNLRIYGEHVYLFHDYVLITVFHLPRNLKKIAHKINNNRVPREVLCQL